MKAEIEVLTSFSHTEIKVPVAGGEFVVLWKPFTTRKARKTWRAFNAVIDAYRS